MKRFSLGVRLSVLVVFGLLLCSGPTGCALFHKPDAAFIAGVDAGVNGSGYLDEYEKYVDADTKLSADGKKIRHDTATGLRKLIKDAQAR